MKEKELMEEKKVEETGENLKENMEERTEERDFDREIRELIEKYPELAGKSLPSEVVMSALDGMDLTKAYEAYREEHSHAEEERGEKKTALRAPVRGVSGGEAVRMQGEDDFLRGFNA